MDSAQRFQPVSFIHSKVEKIRERQKGAINARQLKFLQARIFGQGSAVCVQCDEVSLLRVNSGEQAVELT